jgi:hypothetical protein
VIGSGDEQDNVVSAPLLTTTSAAPQVTTTTPPTTTSTTTTTIPPIEALIPLSVAAITEEVGESVGFVLSQQGTGSGVVISENLLVTNAHVAWPDRTVSLVFRNGATFQGRVLAIDPFVDLAVVDISQLTRKPPPIAIGSTGDLEVGDELFVVGYPSPDEFTPEPTIDSGGIVGFTDWEFTGVGWFTIEAPAIGGQSGGAIVDEFGRAVGISTFGSSTSLTSISIDDVIDEVDRMLSSTVVRGLEPRLIPHDGARRSNTVEIAGEWDQQLLFGWFRADAVFDVEWSDGSGDLAAATIGGDEIVAAADAIQVGPTLAFPIVVTASAQGASEGSLESSLPLIAYNDPDHGKTLARVGGTAGVYEVGGDRDFFYLELQAGDEVTVTIESSARTRLRIYSPAGELLAEDTDFSGFIGDNASTQLIATDSGRHIVAVESSLSTVAGYVVVTQ